MKHNKKERRFRKQRSPRPDIPAAEPAPTLRAFWAELQRAKAAGEPLPAAPHAAGSGAARRASASCSSGSFRSSGSGSGGAGYGLALIAPDPESQERIRRIMQSLCEKDAKQKR